MTQGVFTPVLFGQFLWKRTIPKRYWLPVRMGMSLTSFFLLNPNHPLNPMPHESAYFPRKGFIQQVGANPFDFTSLDGKTRLKGYWIPNQPNNMSDKTLLMAHGYTAQPQQFTRLIQVAKDLGWNVMTFDFRGHGLSAVTPTTIGELEGLDLGAAFREVIQRHQGDNHPSLNKLILFGYSMGAATIMRLHESLAEHPDILSHIAQQAQGIVLDSPYATFNLSDHKQTGDIAAWWASERWKRYVGYCADAFGTDRSMRYLQTNQPINQFSPADSYRKTPFNKIPTLHLHGLQDEQFPFESHAKPVRESLQSILSGELLTTVDLHAKHSNAWIVDHKEYRQTLRDDATYLKAFKNFLKRIADAEPDTSFGLTG